MTRRGRLRVSAAVVVLLCSCAGDSGPPEAPPVPSVPSRADPGAAVVVSPPANLELMSREADRARESTAADMRSIHAVTFDSVLGYDPLSAANLELILNKLPVATEPFRAALAQTGFAVASSARPRSFTEGYSTIYAADLPVFISADMILEAIYRSHGKILQALEEKSLRPRLQKLLTSLRASLGGALDELEPEVASDLDFYLGVAASLLNGGKVAQRESDEVRRFVRAAMQAEGETSRILFGVERRIDFSQFEPRGHYAGSPALESYFRAMMWLGRVDFKLIETQEDGTQVLRRRQVESVLALRRLVDSDALSHYRAIDATISAFAGAHDYLTLQNVDALLAEFEATDGIAGVDDVTLANAILSGGIGEQRIASHVMRRAPGDSETFPLNMSFALLGQRYTVDSHVLSNLVYDRLPTRVVPDPLDAAFAALGNDQAVSLLGTELDTERGYAGELSAMRWLVDQHSPEYWESSLYTGWLNALRALSPTKLPSRDLPSVARTEAWGRRLLNTQLSSWAQLRHNNVLYAKQSYTWAAACEYPDAYVDPYPDFFHGVVRFAERAQQLVASLELEPRFGRELENYFARVARINRTLADMAFVQRTGAPHSAEHMTFINRAVQADTGCDGTPLGHTGWYSDLHIDPLEAIKADPVITDVHTDIGGELPVARPPSVLHVGTGLPRMMIVTVDSCQGARAYVGVVSSYSQVLEEGLNRLTDEEWMSTVSRADPPRVPWLAPILP